MATCLAFTDVTTRDSGLTWASLCNIVADVIIFLLGPVIPQTGLPGVGPGGKPAKPGKAPVPGKYMYMSIEILQCNDRLHFTLSISSIYILLVLQV